MAGKAKVVKKATRNEDIVKELEEKIEAMEADRDAKCKAAKDQLLDMLHVTAEKYGTATGVAEALRTLRFTMGETVSDDILGASKLAAHMVNETMAMMAMAADLDYKDMGKLCDSFFEKDYKVNEFDSFRDKAENLAFELMRIDLCRNVGGAAEDMVGFIERVQEEIDATKEELAKAMEVGND